MGQKEEWIFIWQSLPPKHIWACFICKIAFFFFLGGGYWGLSPGVLYHWATSLAPTLIFIFIFYFETCSWLNCPSNLWSCCLSFLSSWDYSMHHYPHLYSYTFILFRPFSNLSICLHLHCYYPLFQLLWLPPYCSSCPKFNLIQFIFLFLFLKWGLAMLPRLTLNSWNSLPDSVSQVVGTVDVHHPAGNFHFEVRIILLRYTEFRELLSWCSLVEFIVWP